MHVTVKRFLGYAEYDDGIRRRTFIRGGSNKNPFVLACSRGVDHALTDLGIRRKLKEGEKVTFDLVEANPKRHKRFMAVEHLWNAEFSFNSPYVSWPHIFNVVPAILKPLTKAERGTELYVRAVNVEFSAIRKGRK